MIAFIPIKLIYRGADLIKNMIMQILQFKAGAHCGGRKSKIVLERRILPPEFQNHPAVHIQIFMLHIRIIAKHFQGNGAVVTGSL